MVHRFDAALEVGRWELCGRTTVACGRVVHTAAAQLDIQTIPLPCIQAEFFRT